MTEVFPTRITGTQIALKLGLRRFQSVYFRGLSGKLAPEVCDHLVAVRDFCTRDLAVVAGVAQLFFEGGLSGTWSLLAWLWYGGFDDVSRSTHTDAICEETHGYKKQNPGGIEQPDVLPGGLA